MNVLLVPWAFVTTTGTWPTVGSSGTNALICPGLMNAMYAARPFTVTCTPPSVVGRTPLLKSPHAVVVVARLDPKIEIHVADAMVGWKLAPFVTLVMEGAAVRASAMTPPVKRSWNVRIGD